MKHARSLVTAICILGPFATAGLCEGLDANRKIRVKNPYDGIKGHESAPRSLSLFHVGPKGSAKKYAISDWHVEFDFELNSKQTLVWGYREVERDGANEYVLYPARWNPIDESHFPHLLCMEESRLFVTVQKELSDVSEQNYREMEGVCFKNYYEILKLYHGGIRVSLDPIEKLKKLEKEAGRKGLEIVRTGIAKSRRYEVISAIQDWHGWMLDAVLKDLGNGNLLNYDRTSESEDEILRNWILLVIKNRLYSARKTYATRWPSHFPDNSVSELTARPEVEPEVKNLLEHDATFFFNRVFTDPWKGLIKRAIESRSTEIKAACEGLIYGTELVTAINPITGKPLNLHPVLWRKQPSDGDPVWSDLRLMALEEAVSILLREE